MKIESRGITCLACRFLDLKGMPEHAKTGFGQCTVAEPVHFVSVQMARNCKLFEPAAPDLVEARDTWAAKLPLFWQRK